jgi:hypothetical protein
MGRAVQQFKRDESLGFTQFSDIGPRTIHRLDELVGESDLDEPQRFDPAKKPAPEPDVLDVDNASKKKVPVGTLGSLVVKLIAQPPDRAGVVKELQGQDIPTMYVTIHALHDRFHPDFLVLKGLIDGRQSGRTADQGDQRRGRERPRQAGSGLGTVQG